MRLRVWLWLWWAASRQVVVERGRRLRRAIGQPPYAKRHGPGQVAGAVHGTGDGVSGGTGPPLVRRRLRR
ncbi:hypothetical protein GCM10009727_12070 [Actinomadura napierensis]|uniref:Secreted protein n=1 Tax=Actinomadura napierensis TaxID=267854 RepID=A0ABP5JY12_9ACTN